MASNTIFVSWGISDVDQMLDLGPVFIAEILLKIPETWQFIFKHILNILFLRVREAENLKNGTCVYRTF